MGPCSCRCGGRANTCHAKIPLRRYRNRSCSTIRCRSNDKQQGFKMLPCLTMGVVAGEAGCGEGCDCVVRTLPCPHTSWLPLHRCEVFPHSPSLGSTCVRRDVGRGCLLCHSRVARCKCFITVHTAAHRRPHTATDQHIAPFALPCRFCSNQALVLRRNDLHAQPHTSAQSQGTATLACHSPHPKSSKSSHQESVHISMLLFR
jgi:hypothetical protein